MSEDSAADRLVAGLIPQDIFLRSVVRAVAKDLRIPFDQLTVADLEQHSFGELMQSAGGKTEAADVRALVRHTGAQLQPPRAISPFTAFSGDPDELLTEALARFTTSGGSQRRIAGRLINALGDILPSHLLGGRIKVRQFAGLSRSDMEALDGVGTKALQLLETIEEALGIVRLQSAPSCREFAAFAAVESTPTSASTASVTPISRPEPVEPDGFVLVGAKPLAALGEIGRATLIEHELAGMLATTADVFDEVMNRFPVGSDMHRVLTSSVSIVAPTQDDQRLADSIYATADPQLLEDRSNTVLLAIAARTESNVWIDNSEGHRIARGREIPLITMLDVQTALINHTGGSQLVGDLTIELAQAGYRPRLFRNQFAKAARNPTLVISNGTLKRRNPVDENTREGVPQGDHMGLVAAVRSGSVSPRNARVFFFPDAYLWQQLAFNAETSQALLVHLGTRIRLTSSMLVHLIEQGLPDEFTAALRPHITTSLPGTLTAGLPDDSEDQIDAVNAELVAMSRDNGRMRLVTIERTSPGDELHGPQTVPLISVLEAIAASNPDLVEPMRAAATLLISEDSSSAEQLIRGRNAKLDEMLPLPALGARHKGRVDINNGRDDDLPGDDLDQPPGPTPKDPLDTVDPTSAGAVVPKTDQYAEVSSSEARNVEDSNGSSVTEQSYTETERLLLLAYLKAISQREIAFEVAEILRASGNLGSDLLFEAADSLTLTEQNLERVIALQNELARLGQLLAHEADEMDYEFLRFDVRSELMAGHNDEERITHLVTALTHDEGLTDDLEAKLVRNERLRLALHGVEPARLALDNVGIDTGQTPRTYAELTAAFFDRAHDPKQAAEIQTNVEQLTERFSSKVHRTEIAQSFQLRSEQEATLAVVDADPVLAVNHKVATEALGHTASSDPLLIAIEVSRSGTEAERLALITPAVAVSRLRLTEPAPARMADEIADNHRHTIESRSDHGSADNDRTELTTTGTDPAWEAAVKTKEAVETLRLDECLGHFAAVESAAGSVTTDVDEFVNSTLPAPELDGFRRAVHQVRETEVGDELAARIAEKAFELRGGAELAARVAAASEPIRNRTTERFMALSNQERSAGRTQELGTEDSGCDGVDRETEVALVGAQTESAKESSAEAETGAESTEDDARRSTAGRTIELTPGH